MDGSPIQVPHCTVAPTRLESITNKAVGHSSAVTRAFDNGVGHCHSWRAATSSPTSFEEPDYMSWPWAGSCPTVVLPGPETSIRMMTMLLFRRLVLGNCLKEFKAELLSNLLDTFKIRRHHTLSGRFGLMRLLAFSKTLIASSASQLTISPAGWIRSTSPTPCPAQLDNASRSPVTPL